MTVNRANELKRIVQRYALVYGFDAQAISELRSDFEEYAAAEVDAAVKALRCSSCYSNTAFCEDCTKRVVGEAMRAERERCLSAVDNEPENPGKMPDEMWEAISRDRDACEKAFQINTALTKRNISQSIRLSKLEKESK
jgi:hypothetical protein